MYFVTIWGSRKKHATTNGVSTTASATNRRVKADGSGSRVLHIDGCGGGEGAMRVWTALVSMCACVRGAIRRVWGVCARAACLRPHLVQLTTMRRITASTLFRKVIATRGYLHNNDINNTAIGSRYGAACLHHRWNRVRVCAHVAGPRALGHVHNGVEEWVSQHKHPHLRGTEGVAPIDESGGTPHRCAVTETTETQRNR